MVTKYKEEARKLLPPSEKRTNRRNNRNKRNRQNRNRGQGYGESFASREGCRFGGSLRTEEVPLKEVYALCVKAGLPRLAPLL